MTTTQAEREKRREFEGMAECMDMVRQELIAAGIISKDVPPMMVANAVVSALHAAVAGEREACAKVCEAKSDAWSKVDDDTSSVLQSCANAIRARGNP